MNTTDHRFTKIKHSWTNGQVERMNRTIKDARVKRFHYQNPDQLRHHLHDFIAAYNFGRRLKTLKGRTSSLRAGQGRERPSASCFRWRRLS